MVDLINHFHRFLGKTRAPLLTALLGAITLTACVTSTPYGPADRTGFGYADQRIEDSRYRVTFRGNASTRRETVENFLLFRAAELTVQNGYDYFVVVENDTEARSYFSTLYGTGFHGRVGGFGPFYGRRGFRRFGAFPYYPYGFGFGPDYFQGQTIENTQYSAIAFISMHRGEKPSDEPAAFNARSVMDNLRPLINDTNS